MIRHVRTFNDARHMIRFDDVTGRGELVPAETVTKDIHGFGCRHEGLYIVIYPHAAGLTVQAGTRRWNLESDDVSTEYIHDAGTSTFRIRRAGKTEWEATYPSWWIEHPERILPSLDAPADEDEDFFGYLHSVWRSSEKRKNLAQLWSD